MLSEMHFYNLKNPGTFGVRTELCRTHYYYYYYYYYCVLNKKFIHDEIQSRLKTEILLGFSS